MDGQLGKLRHSILISVYNTFFHAAFQQSHDTQNTDTRRYARMCIKVVDGGDGAGADGADRLRPCLIIQAA